MWKSMFLLSFLLAIVPLHGQEKQLPVEIRNSFEKKFPTARNLDWYFENNSYLLEFEMSSDAYAVSYDSTGKWIETGIVISDMDIPEVVKSAINQKCPKHVISYSEKMENAKGEKFFRVHCYNENADFTFNVNSSGKVLGFEKKETFEKVEAE